MGEPGLIRALGSRTSRTAPVSRGFVYLSHEVQIKHEPPCPARQLVSGSCRKSACSISNDHLQWPNRQRSGRPNRGPGKPLGHAPRGYQFDPGLRAKKERQTRPLPPAKNTLEGFVAGYLSSTAKRASQWAFVVPPFRSFSLAQGSSCLSPILLSPSSPNVISGVCPAHGCRPDRIFPANRFHMLR
jgi:hypothetical protein